MTDPRELLRWLTTDNDPVAWELLSRLDVLDVAQLALTLLREPSESAAAAAIAGAERAARERQANGEGHTGPAEPITQIPPAVLLRSVAAGEPHALDLAGGVHPVGMCWLALVAWAWPSTEDAERWCDTFVIADRSRTLEETW